VSSTPAGGFDILGVADRPAVAALLADLVCPNPDAPNGAEVRMLRPEQTAEAARRLATLPLEPIERFEGLTPDQIVDVPPSPDG
jgi:hypothetical protein